MLALDGMMNALRNRGMYLRVGERLVSPRRREACRNSQIRKISQAKLAKLLGVVKSTIQNYEHGRKSRT
jgi:DNA-binding transcriptional regulator YiaG